MEVERVNIFWNAEKRNELNHGGQLDLAHILKSKLHVLEHITNDYVRSNVKSLVGRLESLLATIIRRKISWYGHVRGHKNLCKTFT